MHDSVVTQEDTVKCGRKVMEEERRKRAKSEEREQGNRDEVRGRQELCQELLVSDCLMSSPYARRSSFYSCRLKSRASYLYNDATKDAMYFIVVSEAEELYLLHISTVHEIAKHHHLLRFGTS